MAKVDIKATLTIRERDIKDCMKEVGCSREQAVEMLVWENLSRVTKLTIKERGYRF